jgi:molecular chaperone HtpG
LAIQIPLLRTTWLLVGFSLSSMKIPPRIEVRLNENPQLAGAVKLVVEGFIKSLNNPQQLFFFPEYTDHGCNHIEGVLASIDALITADSYALLTSEDVGALVLATLLHDSAMHFHADSFLDLINDNKKPLVPELDDKSWKEEFEVYFSHARRWDERKLYRILGDQNEPELTQDTIETVRLHPTKKDADLWTTKYRKFLGEFIRQKHARLAHEIALKGKGSSVALKQYGIPDDLIDLIGLIARSHHLPLRSTFSYLTDKYGSRIVCQNTHPIYLMVLLRVADYLQIQATRVNSGFLGVQRLRSPLSQEEWNTHLVVKSVQKDDNDQECLYIRALPQSASLFIKLQKLLEGLQSELDTSWAVLGEIYSKEPELKKFGLTIRRIRSNVSDSVEFLKRQKPPFYPVHAALDTTGASMLKLLIKPLYGNRPEVGVRELLQNSLDAVREFEQMVLDNPEYRSVPRLRQACDILIKIEKEDDGDWLTISDRGIGMTSEIINLFYLRAGASFRQSDAWWNDFVSDGKSKILRSGRFGIGALAAFLLGNQIQVITRNLRSSPENGVAFNASIETDSVELRRVAVSEIGTTIRIHLTEFASKNLRAKPKSWDWYVLKKPTVERFIDKKKQRNSSSFPNRKRASEKNDWQTLNSNEFEAVQWTYREGKTVHEGNTFACNGIKIAEWDDTEFSYEEVRNRAHPFYELIDFPIVSVYDPDANLCLNLQRTNIESEAPFGEDLMREIYSEFIAFLLVHGPRSFSEVSRFSRIRSLPISIQDAWCGHIHGRHVPAFVYGDAFGILTPKILESTKSNKIIKYLLGDHRQFIKKSLAPDAIEIFAQMPSDSQTLSFLIWSDYSILKRPHLMMKSGMVVLQPEHSKYLIRAIEDHNENRDGIIKISNPNGSPFYVSSLFNATGSLLSQVETLIEKSNEENIVVACEIHPNWKEAKFAATTFDDIWEELCPSAVIPFDLEKRKRVFLSTYEALKRYIKMWESSRLVGWRKSPVSEIRKGT